MTYRPRKWRRIQPTEAAKRFARNAYDPKFLDNCNTCFLHDEPEADCPWCAKQAEKERG